jgi:hypothetical protein
VGNGLQQASTSDSWINFEFVRIRVDSVGDETSVAGFGSVSRKKMACPWVSPGPRARQVVPLASLGRGHGFSPSVIRK